MGGAEERDGVGGPVDEAIGDRRLERRCEVGPVLPRKRADRERRHLLAQRRLEAREREVAARPPLERPRQRVARGVTGLRGALDRGTAGKSQAQQLRALVEGFARSIVYRGAEAAIAADALDDEQLAMPARDQQQEKRKRH